MFNKIGTKSLLALAILLGATVVGVSTVSADTTETNKPNFMSGFATALAQKFGLNETEVNSFLNTEMQKHRDEMQAKFAQNFADRLAKAVTDGKLTQSQADQIKTKQAEIKSEMDKLHAEGVPKTSEQKEKMKALIDSVKSWAEANNIPNEYLMLGGHGFKGQRGNFNKPPQV